MTLHHLAYLQQVGELLEDLPGHKPIAARLGFIAKKIAAKHTIHIQGVDTPKLRRCKACQAPISCDNLKISDKSLLASCSLCGHKRRYGLSKTVKKPID